ncbi:NAD-dependent epimerase/dehydratase family protein [Bacillus sp. ISL-40]|uniref:NAD-dependent epimerase/dehydratase family protein n=1 Tax=Bacillus sp. ISL-40 TaxID=2819126 RepID=UPI0027DF2465|nr:NAD-dependent epimerase/dehydratase family protein [Bacillus sp. ISL-40]
MVNPHAQQFPRRNQATPFDTINVNTIGTKNLMELTRKNNAKISNDDGRVITNFVTEALKGDDITVYGDGTQTRSFCYVTDTIRGLKLLMEKDEANVEIINIGNPVEKWPI